MDNQNTIKTIFEYTSTGYKESIDTLNETLALNRELKKEQAELSQAQAENSKTITKLTEKWQAYSETLNASSTKEAREDFVKTKKAIEDVTVAQAKVISQKDTNAKAIERESAKLKEAEAITKNYRKVMDELSKGIDNAKVSTEAMSKAKKYLNEQLGKTDTGTEKYKVLSKELAVVTKGLDDVTAAQKIQIKQFGVAENSVEAMRQRVSALNKVWREMDRSNPDLSKITDDLSLAVKELKAAEAEVGIFSRNVGNYKSTFDGMGMSIAQLTREAPAFAHSMTTGFMAISNNIPMLVDEITKLKTANATLNAEGIKTPSVFSTIAKSFFSWNTLISTGIVLLTVYGKDIVNWVVSLFKAEDALKSVTYATSQFNKTMTEGAQAAQSEIVKLKTLRGVSEDAARSTEERTEAAKELQRLYPDYLGNISTENILLGKTSGQYEILTKEILKVAKAKAAMNKITENFSKQLEIEGALGVKEYIEAEKKLKELRKGGISIYEREQFAKLTTVSDLTLKVFKKNNEELYKEIKDKGLSITEYLNALSTESENLAKVAENGIITESKIAEDAAKEAEERAKKAKEAANAALQAQQKINADYIKAEQDKQKAELDLAKAEQTEDAKSIELYRAVLSEKTKAFEEADKQKRTLTQLQNDELELAEYQHQKELEQIKEDATQKEKDRIEKNGDSYLKAYTEEINAQARLLEAKKGGNEQEITLYTRLLQQKRDALKKFEDEQITLNEEQQLEKDTTDFETQQKAINDYITLQQQFAQLNKQFQDTGSTVEREAIQKQINVLNAKIQAQVKGLETLGVVAKDIIVEIPESADKVQTQLTKRLQQSIGTINELAGKSKNVWYKTASSIAVFMSKTFEKMDKDLVKGSDEWKKAQEEKLAAMSELGAAVALNGLSAVTDTINADLEEQKKAIDELYNYQEKKAKESYDNQSNDLKEKLSKNEISEAKYRLEQMKLDDKKAAEDKKREKDKANALYEIELKKFRLNQAQAAIGIMIATALAIMQGFAQTGPIAGGVYAAIVGGLGAVQTALVYAQKPPQRPKFEKGGGVRFEKIEGDSHANGGVPIRFGDKIVAEAEGDEGALIISRKAMRNRYMRNLLRKVENANADISGASSNDGMFEDGGSMKFKSYDANFFIPARNSLRITKRKKRSIRINGDKVSLKPYGWDADAAIDAAADEIAQRQWNDYVAKTDAELSAKEKDISDKFSEGISNNETFKANKIKNVTEYNSALTEKQEEIDILEKQTKVYEDTAKARIEALKTEMQYEEQLAKFDAQRSEATKQLETDTKAFNVKILDSLRDTGQITAEEYDSMLDQITNGYGISTTDIINLKKKEVEAVKKLINEERNAAIKAAQDTASYREKALEQIRSDWQEEYNDITKQIIEDVEGATDAVAKLSGTDLERYNQILAIQQRIKSLNEDYQKNETILTDGVIESREERAKLLEEQKRIQEELKIKEEEAEKAKAAFEEERSKNMDAAQSQWEKDNFESLLKQIKELGTSLQEDANKWSLDKALAEELNNELSSINSTYDEQIAKQDEIVAGLERELDAMELAHDKKIANIKKEEAAFKESFEAQKKEIESWLSDATSEMKSKAASLSSVLTALKLAGYEAGIKEYEAAMDALNKDLDEFKSKGNTPKYEDGGAINIGSGLYQVSGASHAQGGVAIKVGNTKIAEVEGVEKMLAINKYAANDPDMIAALNKASEVNNRYTGVPLTNSSSGTNFTLDYDKLAQSIGAQINSRPVETFVTHTAIDKAMSITSRHRRASFMS